MIQAQERSPHFRNKGLSTRIFNESIPVLKMQHIEQYLLEVIQTNAPAVSVYTKSGFNVNREFDYYFGHRQEVKLNSTYIPQHIALSPTDLSLAGKMVAMWDHEPSWQNNMQAVSKVAGLVIIGAFDEDTLVGYGMIEASSGDIPQLAVAHTHRRQGIGSAILKELLSHNKHPERIKVINTIKGDERSSAFLEKHHVPKMGSQFEMIRTL